MGGIFIFLSYIFISLNENSIIHSLYMAISINHFEYHFIRYTPDARYVGQKQSILFD